MSEENEQESIIVRIIASITRIAITSACGFLLVFAGYLFYWPALFQWDFSNSALGDSFGYWNSIFSGLALLGVVLSIILQSKELRAQREALFAQRAEMEKTSTALNGQLAQQRKDNFEATFFRLLEIFNQVILSVKVPVFAQHNTQGNSEMTGAEVFEFTCQLLGRVEASNSGDRFEVTEHFILGGIDGQSTFSNAEFFELLYEKFADDFGQYYRLLFNLLELINEADFLEDQHRYAKILRAGLNTHQVILLALNCASNSGQEQMFGLVVKYRLLKYLPSKVEQDF